MSSLRPNLKVLGLASASVIAALALSGCARSAHLSHNSDPDARVEVSGKRSERGIAAAERAVERNPQGASLRAELGSAYLESGRFLSAETAFNDAMRLGDNSSRTALSLALAKIGAGHGREAVAILDDWRDSIPASDLGLALALAGETGRGVALLSDTLRAGDNTPKLRQNLAYAYALDGRWREARTMMEQDVPADQVDQRISDWALQAKPDDYQKRVAGLLGAPVRVDPGQPQRLALQDAGSVEQLAAEASATQAVAQPASAHTELPAAGEGAEQAPVLSVAQPAYNPPAPVAAAPSPVVQTTFSSAFVAPQPAAAPARRPTRTVRFALPASRPVVARSGSHLVQLGSYSSAQGARRGWGILAARNPKLRDYRMVIIPAVVNGKNYWRVAAGGFDAGTARGLCSSVKNRGGACFAYSSVRAPAGASPVPVQGISGPQRARRR